MGTRPWNNILDAKNRLGDYQKKVKKKKRGAPTSTKANPIVMSPLSAQDNRYAQMSANQDSSYVQDGRVQTGNPFTVNQLMDVYNQNYGSQSNTGYVNPSATVAGSNPINNSTIPEQDQRNGSGGTDTPWNDWTGFAGDYTNIVDLVGNPEILVRDMLKNMGFNADAGAIDALQDDAGMLEALMLMGATGKDSLGSMTDEDFINFVGNWTQQMATPGAGTPDAMALIQNVLDAPDGSALAASLAAGTPEQQAAFLNQLVGVAGNTLTPLAQRALMASLEGRTDDWLSAQAKGGKDPLTNWLQKGGAGILGR